MIGLEPMNTPDLVSQKIRMSHATIKDMGFKYIHAE